MTHYQLIASNKRKSFLVIFGFIAFVVLATLLMAEAFGYGTDIIGIALIFSGTSSIVSYYFSDKIILAISNAKPATREKHFNFFTVAENLCIGARMPKPKLYVIEDTAMNAFATGRDPEHAVICATTGLLQRLNRAEIEGVIAHELSHIGNRDILLMSIVTVLVGLISLLADWMLRASRFDGRKKSSNNKSGQLQGIVFIVGILLALLSPLIAQLIKLAISRNREFLADASGVGLTKNPEGLINALQKISQDKEPLEAANKATAHLYIANPLKNVHSAVGLFSKMFNTHPPVEERIAKLRGI